MAPIPGLIYNQIAHILQFYGFVLFQQSVYHYVKFLSFLEVAMLLKRYRMPACTLVYATMVVQQLIVNLPWLQLADAFGNPHLIDLRIGFIPVVLNCTVRGSTLVQSLDLFL